jgi:hypothetical protein
MGVSAGESTLALEDLLSVVIDIFIKNKLRDL